MLIVIVPPFVIISKPIFWFWCESNFTVAMLHAFYDYNTILSPYFMIMRIWLQAMALLILKNLLMRSMPHRVCSRLESRLKWQKSERMRYVTYMIWCFCWLLMRKWCGYFVAILYSSSHSECSLPIWNPYQDCCLASRNTQHCDGHLIRNSTALHISLTYEVLRSLCVTKR